MATHLAPPSGESYACEAETALHREASTLEVANTPVISSPGSANAPTRTRRKDSIRVRLPLDHDWTNIRRIVHQHHHQTIFRHLPFSDAKYDALEREARRLVPHQCLIVAERSGEIVGMAWFSAGEHVLGEGGILTTVHLLAVDVERCRGYGAAKIFGRLMQAIKLWSISRHATHIMVHVTTGERLLSTDRLLRSSGARSIGGSYVF